MINTSSVFSPFQENHLRDTKAIRKKLKSPQVLFDQEGEEITPNNCPICLESLVD
jgi:hypothetical protein